MGHESDGPLVHWSIYTNDLINSCESSHQSSTRKNEISTQDPNYIKLLNPKSKKLDVDPGLER